MRGIGKCRLHWEEGNARGQVESATWTEGPTIGTMQWMFTGFTKSKLYLHENERARAVSSSRFCLQISAQKKRLGDEDGWKKKRNRNNIWPFVSHKRPEIPNRNVV